MSGFVIGVHLLSGCKTWIFELASGDGAVANDALKAAMLNQLGIELVPGRAQVEMLVVRKAE